MEKKGIEGKMMVKHGYRRGNDGKTRVWKGIEGKIWVWKVKHG